VGQGGGLSPFPEGLYSTPCLRWDEDPSGRSSLDPAAPVLWGCMEAARPGHSQAMEDMSHSFRPQVPPDNSTVSTPRLLEGERR
jgi:hypothetical protein